MMQRQRTPKLATRAWFWFLTGVLAVGVYLVPGTVPAAAQCTCPWVGDANADGATDASDLVIAIDAILRNGPQTQDAGCPKVRVDYNADGHVDIRDVETMADGVFLGLSHIVSPCVCVSQPQSCEPAVDPTPGAPGNSVAVESKTIIEGSSGATIQIAITNDVTLRGMAVPLVVREITPGSYITALQMAFTERLTNTLNLIQNRNGYHNPDGSCPGGFSTVDYSNSSTPVAVSSSPEGILFFAETMFGPTLAAGTDVNGSLLLTVDVTSTPGTFEIDTTCIDPNNHLLFIQNNPPTNSPVVPAFTKGIITIVANVPPVAVCQPVAVSTDGACIPVEVSIDAGSFDPDGGGVTVTQDPPGPYPLGQTSVTLTVEDENGATDQCTALVTVEDNAPPVITCPEDISINIPPVYTGWVVAFEATATDNCSGGVTVSYSHTPGGFFPNGTTEVTCTATDASGNVAECSFFITITALCFDRLGDLNCDGVMDPLDLNLLIDALYFGGTVPPCTSTP